MKSLVGYMDRLGIERVMLYMGMNFIEDPSPEQLREQNDAVLRAIRRLPERAFGFVYLSPKHVGFSLQEFDRCVRDGPMVGVKLWVAKRCNAPELDPIIERASAMQALIFQHTWLKINGNLPGESTPFDIVELARRHPKAMLICGHAGGDWERGIRAIRGTRSLTAGVAGSDPTSGITEMAVRELGAERPDLRRRAIGVVGLLELFGGRREIGLDAGVRPLEAHGQRDLLSAHLPLRTGGRGHQHERDCETPCRLHTSPSCGEKRIGWRETR